MARIPIGWRRVLRQPARYPRVMAIDPPPSVSAVEQLLALASARSSEVPPTVGSRLSVSHALWLCACETEEPSERWLIYAIGEDGIGWRRLEPRQVAQDVVEATHLTGDHPSPEAVLEWLRGELRYPRFGPSDFPERDFIYDELIRRVRLGTI